MTTLTINRKLKSLKNIDSTYRDLNIDFRKDIVKLYLNYTGYSEEDLFNTYVSHNATIHKKDAPLTKEDEIMLSIYAKQPEYVKLADDDLSVDQIGYILDLYNTF